MFLLLSEAVFFFMLSFLSTPLKNTSLKVIVHMFLRFPTCVLREIVMFSRTKQLGFLTSKNKHLNANGKNCAWTYNLFSLFGSCLYIYFICGMLPFHCLELIILLFVQVLETADTLGEVT